MLFNPEKCHLMSFYRSQRFHFDYTTCDVTLDVVEFKSDLGVIFDRQLNFKPHIEHIVNSANKSMGYFLRLGRNLRSLKVMRVLFFMIVRTKLEYACIIWSPIKKS